MTNTDTSRAGGMPADDTSDQDATLRSEMDGASDRISDAKEYKRMGVVLTDETLKCRCGHEVKLVGSWRVMRGTDIRCVACGLPLIVFGPTVISVEQQRDSVIHMLRKLVSPGLSLRSMFRNRNEAAAALIDRIGEEKKRPYTLELHRRT